MGFTPRTTPEERPSSGPTGEVLESQIDLLWAAVAGLRADVARLVGRLERMGEQMPQGDAEAVAKAWREKRQEEIDRLLKYREAQGKSEELDAEDQDALARQWMDS